MKREIKFRAKDKRSGEWCIGELHLLSRVPHIHINLDVLSSIPIDPDTVGQYTGLKDKNGKEIYEGDIIGCHNPNIKHLIFYNEAQGRFMAALNGDIENDYFGVCGLDSIHWNSTKEVIGNIYDNPELLTEK